MPDELPQPPRNALLVTDRFFMSPYDGSTSTFTAWLIALKRLGYRVAVISFNQARLRWNETDLAKLAAEADSVLILEAHRGRAWAALGKVEDMAWRLLTGRRHPRRVTGRRHLAANAKRIERFVAGRHFDVAVVNKASSLRLLGGALDGLPSYKLLDAHDNVPRRVRLVRSAVLRLVPSHPPLVRLFRAEELGELLNWAGESRMMREEIRQLRGFNAVLFPAEEEAQAFVAAGLSPDVARAVPVPIPEAPAQVTDRTDEFHVGFLGSDAFFNFEGLEFFARHVLPHLRREHPQLRVLIAGGTTRSARRIPELDGVEFIRWVEHVSDFYRRVQVVAVPLLSGTGVSVKTIEAAFYGSAIVTTSVGLRGLALRNEQDVLVADRGEDFAAAISRLLRDPPLRARLGASAAAVIRAHHSLEAFSRAIRTLLDKSPHGERVLNDLDA